MARTSSLSDRQIRQIHQAKSEGLSIRQIAEKLGVTKSQVETALARQQPAPSSSSGSKEKKPSQPVERPDLSKFEIVRSAEVGGTASPGQDEPTWKPGAWRPSTPPPNVFDIKKGLEWLQKETVRLFEDVSDVTGRAYILNQIRQIYADAATRLETLSNIEILDAFINEVTTILEEFEPEVRLRIFRKLESCGLAAGAIGVVAGSSEEE